MKSYRRQRTNKKNRRARTTKKRAMRCKKCNCLCRDRCKCDMKCRDSCHKIRRGGSSYDITGLHAWPYSGPYTRNPHMAFTGKQIGGQGEAAGHFAYTGKQMGGTYRDPVSVNLNTNRGLSGGGVPPPLVGAPWGPNPSSWPGVSGPHNGVTFSLNKYNIQPDTQGVISERSNAYPTEDGTVMMGGGRRRGKKTRKNKRRGLRGGTTSSGVSGFGSQITNNVENTYATFKGERPYPSVMPYEDQFQGSKY